MISAISFVISTQYGRNYRSRVLYWTILIVATSEGYNHNDDDNNNNNNNNNNNLKVPIHPDQKVMPKMSTVEILPHNNLSC